MKTNLYKQLGGPSPEAVTEYTIKCNLGAPHEYNLWTSLLLLLTEPNKRTIDEFLKKALCEKCSPKDLIEHPRTGQLNDHGVRMFHFRGKPVVPSVFYEAVLNEAGSWEKLLRCRHLEYARGTFIRKYDLEDSVLLSRSELTEGQLAALLKQLKPGEVIRLKSLFPALKEWERFYAL